eukprot:m.239003 g.239003  ORF g.239003 m.239003 type:complete len:78 (-) comp54363_c2_seq28:107-340(-)
MQHVNECVCFHLGFLQVVQESERWRIIRTSFRTWEEGGKGQGLLYRHVKSFNALKSTSLVPSLAAAPIHTEHQLAQW